MALMAHRASTSSKWKQYSRFRPSFEALEDRTLLASSFMDNFEGPALDPFWSTLTRSGSIQFPSTVQVHSGNQLVQFDSSNTSIRKNIAIFHDFAEPTYGRFSTWIYDTGANVSSSNYISLTVSNSATGDHSTIVAFDYNFGDGRNYRYGTVNSGGISNIPRTEAWHKFEIVSQPNGTEYWIDGLLQHIDRPLAVDRVNLEMSGPVWRPAHTSYFDDFEFTPYQQTDLEAAALTLNPTQGGANLKYKLTGTQLTQNTTAKLYWANGPTENDILDPAAAPITISQNTPLDAEVTEHIAASDLLAQPQGATHLVAVLDPDKLIDESDEGNNIAALAFPDIALISANLVSKDTIQFGYNITAVNPVNDFNVTAVWSLDDVLDSRDTLAGQAHMSAIGDLSPGTHLRAVRIVNPPPVPQRNAPRPLRYSLLIKVDANDEILESDNANNTGWVAPATGQSGYGVAPRNLRQPLTDRSGWVREARNRLGELNSFLGPEFAVRMTSIIKPGEHSRYEKLDIVPLGQTSWEQIALAASRAGFWVHAEGVRLAGVHWPLSAKATGPHLDLYNIRPYSQSRNPDDTENDDSNPPGRPIDRPIPPIDSIQRRRRERTPIPRPFSPPFIIFPQMIFRGNRLSPVSVAVPSSGLKTAALIRVFEGLVRTAEIDSTAAGGTLSNAPTFEFPRSTRELLTSDGLGAIFPAGLGLSGLIF